MERVAPTHGFKAVESFVEVSSTTPKELLSQRPAPQLREMLVENPQDAIVAFHLAKRSAKLEENAHRYHSQYAEGCSHPHTCCPTHGTKPLASETQQHVCYPPMFRDLQIPFTISWSHEPYPEGKLSYQVNLLQTSSWHLLFCQETQR